MNGTYLNPTRGRKSRTRKKKYLHRMEYIRISCGPQRNRYVHQLVAEAMLGRPLRTYECVDHIDSNPQNNHPSNLRVMTVVGNTNVRNGQKPIMDEVIFDGSEWWKEKNPS